MKEINIKYGRLIIALSLILIWLCIVLCAYYIDIITSINIFGLDLGVIINKIGDIMLSKTFRTVILVTIFILAYRLYNRYPEDPWMQRLKRKTIIGFILIAITLIMLMLIK